jgi:hypothetical protein
MKILNLYAGIGDNRKLWGDEEDLESSILVVGADIIALLKKKKYNVENLFEALKTKTQITLDAFLSTLTFLFIIGFVELENSYLLLKL